MHRIVVSLSNLLTGKVQPTNSIMLPMKHDIENQQSQSEESQSQQREQSHHQEAEAEANLKCHICKCTKGQKDRLYPSIEDYILETKNKDYYFCSEVCYFSM